MDINVHFSRAKLWAINIRGNVLAWQYISYEDTNNCYNHIKTNCNNSATVIKYILTWRYMYFVDINDYFSRAKLWVINISGDISAWQYIDCEDTNKQLL